MSELLTSDPGALRLLMTEELFMLKEETPLPPQMERQQKIAETPEEVPADLTYLGENNKYFLILVKDEKHTHLNKEHQELLFKILQAKSLELRDVAILNLNRYPGIQFKRMKEFFAPSRVVFFGINPQLSGFPAISSNEPQNIENVKVLSTYSFDELKDDVNKKRILWSVLKSF